MKIEHENYLLENDETERTISISGSLRLNGMAEYTPILDALKSLLSSGESRLNLEKLDFLNSSGIAMFSRFVIEARQVEGLNLTLIGSANIPWQGKSLKNLQRLMPAMILELR